MVSPPLPQSASSIAVSATTGSHLLKISGYSQTKLLGNGERLTSAKFKAAGHTWRILFYPNGYLSVDTGSVSVYLDVVGWSKDVCAEVRFSLLRRRCRADDDGTALLYSRPVIRHTFEKYSYRRDITACGFGRFISRKELDTPEYHVGGDDDDDYIILRCDIKVMNKPAVRGNVLLHKVLASAAACRCKDDACKRFHGITSEKPPPCRRRPWLKQMFATTILKCLPF
ncbi:hypothetical protein GUJ93_ZPchr0011g27812 [Zizania palustris]|uniref:MATH domain-containing protein n=1 Tax=Zizania palustris TaxID=103762 RepID=A0A8J6BTR9_ZIZPA|nr:hypothetical protein GUJ93_ZPchr0011g27812 [Zizania palustris]